MSLTDAWRLFDALRSDPRVIYSEEPLNLELAWPNYTQTRSYSPKIWNDAYLAAFAQSCNFILVSFDKAFSHYENLASAILH